MAKIPRDEMEKLYERAEKNPDLDVALEIKKLLWKYLKGIPKKL